MKNVKLIAVVVAAILCALPVAAQRTTEDARVEKKALISDLLKVIDSKQLTQSMMEMLTLRMMDDAMENSGYRASTPEAKKAMEAQAAQRQRTRSMLDRLFARIDYVKYDQEVYVPIFEKNLYLCRIRRSPALPDRQQGRRQADGIRERPDRRQAGGAQEQTA